MSGFYAVVPFFVFAAAICLLAFPLDKAQAFMLFLFY